MKKSRICMIAVFAALILTVTLAVAFGAGTPGSEDDPVVTKSYVDSAIEALKQSLGGSQETPASNSWAVVCVPKNTSVVGETGTQMILRSGSATAIDNGANGISDLTGGADLRMGTAITKNHLLLIPGSDGRGIRTVGECWVMINGGYTLQ